MISSTILWILSSLMLGTGIFIAFRMRAKQRKRVEPLAFALGGLPVIHFFKGSFIKFINYNPEIKLEITPGNENNPPHMVFQRPLSLGFDLTITRKTFTTRALTGLNLLKDIKVGDPLFDNYFRISSTNKAQAMGFLQDPTRKEKIKYFFENGFTELIAAKDSLFIKKTGFTQTDLDPKLVKERLDSFADLNV
jgi:hypothetical protein